MKTKLKDLKYEINGTETNKYAIELIVVTVVAFILALVGLFLLVTFAEQIDQFANEDIDNGPALVILFVGACTLVMVAIKKWVL